MAPCGWLLIPQLCPCTPVPQAAGLGTAACEGAQRGTGLTAPGLPPAQGRDSSWGWVCGNVRLTAFGQTGAGRWGAAPSPFRCSPPSAGGSPQAVSPLSAGSQSDYRKVSAAGCSPCESSPASTPLGEQRTRAPAEETPATPKGGRGAGAACCVPPHQPASPAAASQGPLCTSQCILAVSPGASHASLLHSCRLCCIRAASAAPCCCIRSSAKNTLKRRPGQVQRSTAQRAGFVVTPHPAPLPGPFPTRDTANVASGSF